MIRAFVGIEMAEPAVSHLRMLQDRLPAGCPVGLQDLHLTLVFLGDRPEAEIAGLRATLAAIRAPAFRTRLAGLEILAGSRPRVLAASVTPEPELLELHEKVCAAVRRAGLAMPQRRFRPHVTLARFSPALSGEDRRHLRGFAAGRSDYPALEFPVDAFHLYRSNLTESVPMHAILASYPLA